MSRLPLYKSTQRLSFVCLLKEGQPTNDIDYTVDAKACMCVMV